MKRIVVATIAIVAALIAGIPAAQANPSRTVLGGGSGIIVGGDFLCSLTTIGRDNAGRLVGFTAGHCGPPGSSVHAEEATTLGAVGTIVRVNPALDYAVIQFDESRVSPTRTVGNTTITGVAGPAPFPEFVCKEGRSTGHTCGVNLFVDQLFSEQYGFVCITEGDSGGPITSGNNVIGIVSAYFFIPCIGPHVSINMDAVVADANFAGGVGAGFRPI
ncbi:serine protease [Hoyosella rhizosphaerae]|uniref:Peptidase n=1 Tax=Hoyosella rhizosphaerae TaxID=1755582 RepID=A0A916TYI8_9ACTN|nr:serine protease [Hoyosella rhizosphaerae]MBN4927339.1 serine protease [Hoyosella rhizosphaerae]GGC52045.1 peptidase [Hoyosella rhizosphaerae]